MSLYQSTPFRRWSIVILVCYLVALLLPARHVAAADQQILIAKAEVDALIFQMIWQQDLILAPEPAPAAGASGATSAQGKPRKASLYWYPERVVYGELLIRAEYTTPEVWERYKKTYLETIAPGKDNEYRRNLSYDEVLFTMLDVARQMPELRPYVRDVWETLGRSDRDLSRDRSRRLEIMASARRYGKREQLRIYGPQTMQRVFQAAQEIPQVAINFDVLFGEELGMSIRNFDAQEYLAQYPDNLVPPAIVERIREDGTIQLSLNELKEWSQLEFDKLNASIDDIQQTLVELDEEQGEILDYLKDQQKQQALQAKAAAKAAEHKLRLEALNSSIFIFSTLAGFVDPAYGKGLATVGKSALSVYESITGWMDAVAGLSALDKVGSLSTVVMTGNVLGAVMNVVNLFGDSGPTPDQMILQEIGKLRQQVDQLRTEMHDRFDRIDAELNTIYNTMQDRFNLIDIQLGKINAKIEEVQLALVALDLKLSRIERNNFEFLDTLGRRPLLNAINGALGYQERTGLPMPYQPDFIDYENILHTWGTIHAFDPLATGPTQRDYSPGALLAELTAYPLDANLNYLNGWLQAQGYPAISNKRLPSPRDWLFATRTYTQLGMEWPAHMKQIDLQRQAQLDAISLEMEAAMQNISTRTTVTGTVGNDLLLPHVITYYQEKLATLETKLQEDEAVYIQDLWGPDKLNRQEPFDLYGGLDQTLTYQPLALTRMYVGPDEYLSPPNNLLGQVESLKRYILADYLKIEPTEQLRIGGWAYLQNARNVPGCRPDPDVCPLLGDLVIRVSVAYGNVTLAAVEWNAGRVILPVIKGNVEEANDYMARNWVDLKPRFEASAVVVAPTPAEATQRTDLLRTLTRNLEERLALYQHGLYAQLRNELQKGNSALGILATEVAGAKLLLDSFVTLGLPRAVESDDFLRAMLYGNQQLMDNQQILATYALSSTQPITGTQLLSNPRLVLAQEADERAAAFSTMIDRYLDAITTKTHVEASDYIANARRELELTIRLARADEQPPVTPVPPVTPPPPPPVTPVPPSTGPNQLYLPLIER